jgi:hypothetical protein
MAVEKLHKKQLQAALSKLDATLREEGVCGEVCLYGGAAMVLAFDARESTRDVDAIFEPKTRIADAAARIADDLGLPQTWLNDGVKGFISARPDYTEDDLPQFANLRIFRPTAEYLLAMKCLASRVAGYDEDGDMRDVLFLCQRLHLKTVADVLEIVERYYPRNRIPAKTQFFVEEAITRLEEGLQ